MCAYTYLTSRSLGKLGAAQGREAVRKSDRENTCLRLFDSRSTAFLPVTNPIDRYLLNSAMVPDFVRDADGGLMFHSQHDSPGKAGQPNWLPSPEGPCVAVMRLYWPNAEALDGPWKLPASTRAQ
jgi:hypothetical protein